MAFAPGLPTHLCRITPFGSITYRVGVAGRFHRVAMGPRPSSPGSANDRQVSFSFSTAFLSSLTS